ncbi:metal ABC transporter solute-binding protein, Zn/Mn family [cf. Phormidesmis sp. LEGE 11477]|uniref:metal ABC transporter solute-binding protein, Zn/Mn family n=1 Tax=cf. Phormidesmis sp. LEGE 11477 TaxID=1828680 RepID=UPI001880BD04|nr:zinc ABC transporter substrate-binding protein [cf. Phormidesmis sp. LEGE 11477]MBE9062131.1 zinc ABC transporter substrate-binding protein [cf. Phormidesmis sp. LEGE 11477]
MNKSPRFFSKHTASLLVPFSLMLGAVSCTQPSENGQPQAESGTEAESVGGPQVVASYSVLCNMAEQIAQTTVDLTCLIDAGQDPHTYSATPADRRAIEDADLVLYGGYEFEPEIIQMVEATDTPALKVAVSEVAVPDPLMGEPHDHGAHAEGEAHDHAEGETHDHAEGEAHDHAEGEAHDHAEGEAHDHAEGEAHDHAEGELEPDPHVWHDAENGIAMARVVQEQLSEVSPENAELYETNAEALIAQLEQLDTWIQTQMDTVPATSRTLISTHDALGYYAEAYGLEIEPALDSFSTEARPSAANIKELTEVVEAKSVPSIFVESTSNPGLIETVSRETNIAVSQDPIYADSLGEPKTPAATYQGMLVTNTCNIVNGLGGSCDQAAAQALLPAQ